MQERSGIEMIEEILEKLNSLDAQVKLLDQNVKKIMNLSKLNELSEKLINTPAANWANSQKPQISAVNADSVKTKTELKTKMTMVHGKLVVTEGNKEIALGGIEVKVYDYADNLIKTTKTNLGGEWRCGVRSSAGNNKYVVSFNGKYKGVDLIPVNKTFVIKDGVDDLEVI